MYRYVRSAASLLVNESASQFITSSPDHLYVPQPYQFVHLHPSHRKTLDHQLSTEGCDQGHRQSTNRNKTRTIFGKQLDDVTLLRLKQWREHWHSAQKGVGSIPDLILDKGWINLFSTLHQEAFPHMLLFSPFNIKKPTLSVWSI